MSKPLQPSVEDYIDSDDDGNEYNYEDASITSPKGTLANVAAKRHPLPSLSVPEATELDTLITKLSPKKLPWGDVTLKSDPDNDPLYSSSSEEPEDKSHPEQQPRTYPELGGMEPVNLATNEEPGEVEIVPAKSSKDVLERDRRRSVRILPGRDRATSRERHAVRRNSPPRPARQPSYPPPSRPTSYHAQMPFPHKDYGPPQIHYAPPPSFPRRTAWSSRPSSIMSSGSVDSGFGEGDYDASSQRRGSTASRPSSLTTPFSSHGPPPSMSHYYGDWSYPAYPIYSSPAPYVTGVGLPSFGLPPTPQSTGSHTSHLSLPSNSTHTPLSSMSPGTQLWAAPSYPIFHKGDLVYDPDRNKCLKLFEDANRDFKGELTVAELATISFHEVPFQAKTADKLARLFAEQNPANTRYPALKFDEFFALWRSVKEWVSVFETADGDKKGQISQEVLQLALRNLGYHGSVADNVYLPLLKRTPGKQHRFDFEEFVNICIGLQRMTENFQRRELGKSGHANMTLNDYVSGMCTTLAVLILG